MLGDGARRGFEDFGVSVGRAAGFGFGFEGVGGVEVGLGIEEVTGVLALGRGIESEDITRGRGLLESMVDDGQVLSSRGRGGIAGKRRAGDHDRSGHISRLASVCGHENRVIIGC